MPVKLNFLFLILLLSSCKTPSWPTGKFITKWHYQEVRGDGGQRVQVQQKCEYMARYPMYPEGLTGVMKHVRDHTVYPEKDLASNITVEFRQPFRYSIK